MTDSPAAADLRPNGSVHEPGHAGVGVDSDGPSRREEGEREKRKYAHERVAPNRVRKSRYALPPAAPSFARCPPIRHATFVRDATRGLTMPPGGMLCRQSVGHHAGPAQQGCGVLCTGFGCRGQHAWLHMCAEVKQWAAWKAALAVQVRCACGRRGVAHHDSVGEFV